VLPPGPPAGPDTLDHDLRFALQARAGDPDHLHPDQLQLLLADPVALEGGAGAVGLEEVEFDGEALLRPVGVELVARDDEIHRRPRQPGAPGKRTEAALEARAGDRGVRPVEIDRGAQGAAAGVMAAAVENRFQSAEVEQFVFFAASQHRFDPVGRERAREVELRPRQGRDRDPVDEPPVLIRQVGVVDGELRLAMASIRRGDVELAARSVAQQSPEPPGAEVARHGR
jgi:hypothetical protein